MIKNSQGEKAMSIREVNIRSRARLRRKAFPLTKKLARFHCTGLDLGRFCFPQVSYLEDALIFHCSNPSSWEYFV